MQPIENVWLRGVDLNHRPLGYEPNELPDCSTPHIHPSVPIHAGQISVTIFPFLPTCTINMWLASLCRWRSRSLPFYPLRPLSFP